MKLTQTIENTTKLRGHQRKDFALGTLVACLLGRLFDIINSIAGARFIMSHSQLFLSVRERGRD